MIKTYKFLIIICCVIIIIGCKRKASNENSLNKQTVLFSQETNVDKTVLLFFNDYFDDSELNDIDNYFLIIYNTNDTTYLDINIINMEFNYKIIRPIGLIRYKKKNIFIINNNTIFHVKNDKISKLYDENIAQIKHKSNLVKEKHWLFVIDNFTNKYVVIKKEDEIRNIILNRKIENTIKFNVLK